jgi:hypothetical protein
MLKTSIGYNFVHNDGNDVSNDIVAGSNFGEKINDLNFTVTAGKKLKSNFYYGLGLSYNTINQEVNPESDIPELSSSAYYTFVSSYMNAVSKSNVISPIIYLQYYKSITERFYITFDLYSRYDFNQTITESTLYNPNISNNTYDKSSELKTEIKRQYLNFGLFPSLRVNLYKKLGMDLTFGGMEYKIKTVDSRRDIDKKTKEFNIGFNPENWIIGFYLTF